MYPKLSKSTYIYGLQCFKRLYLYKKHYELANPLDEASQAIFQTGTNIGVLAQDLFPNGVNAQGDEEWHNMKTVNRTLEFLPFHDVIYEAAFIYNEVICAIDILVKSNNKYYAFEVKGTTKVKSQHIEDAALQYYVLSNTGLEIEDFSIVTLNNEYIRKESLSIKELFNLFSVKDALIDKQDFVSANISKLKKVLNLKAIPNIEMGSHCNNPYGCNFTQYCESLMPVEIEESISLDPSIHVDKSAWMDFSKLLTYPLHFFDFETISYGVPEFENSRPYQPIAFQYSLHTRTSKRSKTTHQAYLGDGVSDPRLGIVKQMINDLGEIGSIIVWNISFEKTIISKLAVDFPKYAKKLLAINERLVDLMIPFRPNQRVVYSEAFEGSYSLKKVLPIVAPDLSYDVLNIQEGGTASLRYGELKDMSDEEQMQVRKDLLDYCHLDTLAMVKVLDNINDLI